MNKILAKSSGMSLIDHSKLVSRIAVKIAEKSSSGLDSDILESIRLGGLLHDIGKCTKEFQKRLDKTLDTDENLEAKIKFRHNEVGWSFISRYLKLSKKRVYDNVLDVIYWHHGISNIMGKYNDTDIDINEVDIAVMISYLKEIVDESNIVEKDYKPKAAPHCYDNSDDSSEINSERLFVRTCVISADRLASSISDVDISDKDLDSLLASINTRCCDVDIKNHKFYGNPRFLQQQNIVNLTKNTTQINAPAGFGKTLIGLLWSFKRGKQLIWVCPRNVVAESVFKSINEELENFGIDFLSTELYYGGEVKENNFLFKGAFKSDIVVTNIDSYLKPTIDTNNGNLLYTIINADVVFDEYHELIGDTGLFACFINIMRTRNMLTNSKTLLLSATGTWMYKLWDSIDKKTTILPSENKHYTVLRDKKYLLNVTDSLSVKNKDDNNLVILNSIGNSQEYKKKLGFDVLLHSNFIDSDRRDNMSFLYKNYGKTSERHNKKPNFIGTHIIQASLDVSFNNLYESVLSPQSTLQRIGRCDRWGDCISQPSINIINLKNKGEDAIRNILYTNNLANTWFEELKQFDKAELTLNELYEIYNNFETKHEKILNKNIIDKHKDSLDSLHYIYPVKYFNTNKSDNKTSGGNKLRSSGSEIFVICKYFNSDKYTDAFSVRIRTSPDLEFHEADNNNTEKRILGVMKLLRDNNDSRFDYNDIINDKKYLSLDSFRRRAIKIKTPYVRFDKVYHPEYGEITIERLNRLLV